MDQRLKERVIGAIVVVGLGVIFIPMLLSGPKDRAAMVGRMDGQGGDGTTRVVTIDLREHSGHTPRPDAPQASEQTSPPELQTESAQAVARGSPATQDKTPAETRVPSKPAAQGSGQSATPSPSPEPQSAAAGEWAVQVGSFSSRENAGRLASQLKAQGFAAYVSRYQDGGRILHRVRVGPVASRPEAESLAERLSQAGQKVKVVPNP
jgi:DedD protein